MHSPGNADVPSATSIEVQKERADGTSAFPGGVILTKSQLLHRLTTVRNAAINKHNQKDCLPMIVIFASHVFTQCGTSSATCSGFVAAFIEQNQRCGGVAD